MLDITVILKAVDILPHEEIPYPFTIPKVRWFVLAKLCQREGEIFWRCTYSTNYLQNCLDVKSLDCLILVKHFFDYHVVDQPKTIMRCTYEYGDCEFLESDLTNLTPFKDYLDNDGQLKYKMFESQ